MARKLAEMIKKMPKLDWMQLVLKQAVLSTEAGA
jgi:hypothetical protein